MIIQGHRADLEGDCEMAHGERIRAFSVEERQCFGQDPLASEDVVEAVRGCLGSVSFGIAGGQLPCRHKCTTYIYE